MPTPIVFFFHQHYYDCYWTRIKVATVTVSSGWFARPRAGTRRTRHETRVRFSNGLRSPRRRGKREKKKKRSKYDARGKFNESGYTIICFLFFHTVMRVSPATPESFSKRNSASLRPGNDQT